MHHLAHRRVAVLGLLRGRALHHCGERRGDLRPAALGIRKRFAHVLHRHGHLCVRLEGRLSGEHLVEHDPERVDVGLAGDLAPERLFGRHVVRRAEHAAGGGEALGLQRAGDAEVGDLGAAVAVDQDVLRLHVAMDELVLVGALERAADLDRVCHRLGHRQAPEPADALLQRLALHVLEDDVGIPVVLAGVDHGHDVRVVELRDRPGLAAEALELVGIVRDVAVHQLDRDPALERGIERPIDARHPSGPDLLLEPVALTDQRADHRHLFSALRWLYAFATTQILPVPPPGRLSRACAGSWWSSAPPSRSPT